MTVSLENPPIVIKQSTKKQILLTLGCLSLGILFFVTAPQADANRIYVYCAAAFFFAGVPISAFGLYRPVAISLAPDGLTWRTQWRTFHYDWWQLSDFSIMAMGYNKRVCFRYRRKPDGAFWPGTFGGIWEVSPAELKDVLVQAQQRWGKPESNPIS